MSCSHDSRSTSFLFLSQFRTYISLFIYPSIIVFRFFSLCRICSPVHRFPVQWDGGKEQHRVVMMKSPQAGTLHQRCASFLRQPSPVSFKSDRIIKERDAAEHCCTHTQTGKGVPGQQGRSAAQKRAMKKSWHGCTYGLHIRLRADAIGCDWPGSFLRESVLLLLASFRPLCLGGSARHGPQSGIEFLKFHTRVTACSFGDGMPFDPRYFSRVDGPMEGR